jgi:2-polyprenyl-3-methyl-5-hydroxy-6-metoxy-1,4-benzoquinol methylase
MTAESSSEAKIVDSWRENALAWTAAVREGRIESREITDRAIVDAVLSRSPRSVLDIGCGEGWLVRQVTAKNIRAIGVDAVPALIDAAQRAGDGDFRVMSYEEVAAGRLGVSVDVVVCNFSLLGKESVEGVFRAAPSLLNSRGSLIVQTLHPVTACGDLPYRDGWRQGSWAGCGTGFSEPAPWYFRTLESWRTMFAENGIFPCEVVEPVHPKTRNPISVILVGSRRG